MNKLSLLLLFCLIGLSATLAMAQTKNSSAQTKKEKKKMTTNPDGVRFINPPNIHTPRGYSHVVEVKSGRIVFIAGQVSVDKSGNVVGQGDFRAQTEQVFENLKAALEAVGASFENVIKLNTYAVDVSRLQDFRDVRDRYVNTARAPVSTFVQVSRLVREEWLIEVEAVAVVPE